MSYGLLSVPTALVGTHCSKGRKSKDGCNVNSEEFTIPWKTTNSHHQVDNICHTGASTKNCIFIQIVEKTRRKLVMGAAKRPPATLKELQELLASTGSPIHSQYPVFLICQGNGEGWQNPSFIQAQLHPKTITLMRGTFVMVQ